MRRHIEEQKVLFLRGTDSLFDEVLGESLADVSELIAKFERIPCFAAQIFDPRLRGLRRLSLLDVAQGFVEENVARRCVGFTDDAAGGQRSVEFENISA